MYLASPGIFFREFSARVSGSRRRSSLDSRGNRQILRIRERPFTGNRKRSVRICAHFLFAFYAFFPGPSVIKSLRIKNRYFSALLIRFRFIVEFTHATNGRTDYPFRRAK